MHQGFMAENTHIIACKVLHAELAEFLRSNIRVTEIEAFLHSNPAKLVCAIQNAIDQVSANVETVIIAYGLCSKAVIGLHARNFTLVIPKVDDCLALLLGSRKTYMDYLLQNPGSYFLSRGWLECGINMLTDFAEHERRFGAVKARRIHEQMFAHYNRVVFIQTGQSWRQYEQDARKVADFCSCRQCRRARQSAAQAGKRPL